MNKQITKKRCFKHLSYEERIKIETMINQRYSIRRIANELNRSLSSIHDELKLKQVKGEYLAKKAQMKAYQKRYWSKYQCFKALDYDSLIKDKLILRWSPERIGGYLKYQGINISPKAIYKYIHSRCLERYLWKPKKGIKAKVAYLKDYRKFIIKCNVFETGHLEVDFIVSSFNTQCLFVAVDRYSRLTMVFKLSDRSKQTINRVFQLLKQRIKIKDVITDNDIAFRHWSELEKKYHFQMFFTHPYRSWEKPLVEQTNKLIRQFIPKRTDLRLVSNEQLEQVHRFLNQTPRQCLNYLTTYEKHFNI